MYEDGSTDGACGGAAPTEKGSKLEELVRGIRIRKGLKPEIPALDTYYDKL